MIFFGGCCRSPSGLRPFTPVFNASVTALPASGIWQTPQQPAPRSLTKALP